jgi:predicted HTH transcriptional regulator
MIDLKTKADLQRLVEEEFREGLTLDYKASPALSRESKNVDELCKDVSAMANSAGGQLIYGIEEDRKTHKPSAVDAVSGWDQVLRRDR